MSTRTCACCGDLFIIRPQIASQAYCSAAACPRDRRLRWQLDKILRDPDYRENQSRNQRAWHDRHPEYWRTYRGIRCVMRSECQLTGKCETNHHVSRPIEAYFAQTCGAVGLIRIRCSPPATPRFH